MQIIDGKLMAQRLKEEISSEVQEMVQKGREELG